MPPRKLQLRPFQKEDVIYIRKHNYTCLVANAPGTGKTIECLACIALDREKLCPVVIVCPASVCWNWHEESRKWCKWAKVHVIEGRKSRIPKNAHIYIISWALLANRGKELLYRKPKMLIADEAHFAKNMEAMRSRALYGIAKRVEHVLLLTGTPLINNEQELENLKSLFGKPNPPMIRRLLCDVAPDIPPKERSSLPVYLPPSVAREYRHAFEEFGDWLEKALSAKMDAGAAETAARRALAAEALVKVGYLRRLVGYGKVNAAVDFAARAIRIGEPVVFFAEHSDVIRRFSQLLKKQNLRHVALVGSTSKKDRQRMVKEFQAGKIPIFIGSSAASTGITLHKARHLVFIERYWSSAAEEQSEDRIRRIGQKFPTRIWFLHAHGTVDDRIDAIIRRKRRIVHDAIGSEDIVETAEKAVIELMADWSTQVSAPVAANKDSYLGLTKRLPPMPKPNEVCQVVFRGSRWDRELVECWGRMNGYTLRKVSRETKAFRCVVNSTGSFNPGSFTTFKVSQDIRIVKGIPKKKRSSRRKVSILATMQNRKRKRRKSKKKRR